eukprot:c17713_g1_i1.p1 GENE.c17713_g1_i1~~c17713_g1_i1.p1  ORF type:complete len:1798 (+),score=296.92 c17713_g1_i1:771-5396(+)
MSEVQVSVSEAATELQFSWIVGPDLLRNIVSGISWNDVPAIASLRISGPSTELENARVELVITARSDTYLGMSALMAPKQLELRVHETMEGWIEAAFGFCLNQYSEDKVRTSFSQKIPLVFKSSAGCEIEFEVNLASTSEEAPDPSWIEQNFCTPAISTDLEHICFSVRGINVNAAQSDDPKGKILALKISDMKIMPLDSWLFDEPLSGSLFVRANAAEFPATTVLFRPEGAGKRFHANDLAGLKVGFELVTPPKQHEDNDDAHGLAISCANPECLGGTLKMFADFSHLRQKVAKLKRALGDTQFLDDVFERVIQHFSSVDPLVDEDSSYAGTDVTTMRRAQIEFCSDSPSMAVKVFSLVDCANEKRPCYFNSISPPIVSFGASSYPPLRFDKAKSGSVPRLGVFGLVIPHLLLGFPQIKDGVYSPKIMVPITLALPANTNALLGFGLANETFTPPEIFRTLPSISASNLENSAEFIQKYGFEVMLEIFMNTQGELTAKFLLQSSPIDREILGEMFPGISLLSEFPEIVFTHNSNLQLEMNMPINVQCANGREKCLVTTPPLFLLKRLFEKTGLDLAAESVPEDSLSFGQIPGLNGNTSVLFGDEATSLEARQRAGYEEIRVIAAEILAAVDRTQPDLESLNTAFAAANTIEFLKRIGADALVPANQETCVLENGEVACVGQLLCRSPDCHLSHTHARDLLRAYAARALPGTDLNTIQFVDFELPIQTGKEIKINFKFMIARLALPRRINSYFSKDLSPQSSPRAFMLTMKMNQHGNLWAWLRPHSEDGSNDSLRTLMIPEGTSIDTTGVRGLIMRGIMVGYFSYLIADSSLEAAFTVGVDMEFDYFDRRKRPLAMMLQKRLPTVECDAFFDVPEIELPHPASLGTTTTLKNTLFFIHQGRPVPTHTDLSGVSIVTPIGTTSHVHFKAPFSYNDFNWVPGQFTLVSPSYMALPYWMGSHCFFVAKDWPLLCPETEDIELPEYGMEITPALFRADDFVSSFIHSSDSKILDWRRIFAAVTAEPSTIREFSVQLIKGIAASHVFTTMHVVKDVLNGRVTSHFMPMYPNSGENAFDSWAQAIVGNDARLYANSGHSSMSYLHWLIEDVTRRITTRLKRERGIPPGQSDYDLEETLPSTSAFSGTSALRAMEATLDDLLDSVGSGEAKKHSQVGLHTLEAMDDTLSELLGEKASFLQEEEEDIEDEVDQTALVVMSFLKMMTLSSANIAVKGLLMIQLAEVITGPAELNHIVEIGVGIRQPAPDCQRSPSHDKDFCFTSVSQSQVGPSSRKEEQLFQPKVLTSVVQMPVRNVYNEPRIMRPHKRRTLFRTRMDGTVAILGQEGDGSIIATDGSVVLLAVLVAQIEQANDAQKRYCAPVGQVFNMDSCSCLNKKQELDSRCPLMSVEATMTRVEVMMASAKDVKSLDWKVDVTIRNIGTTMLTNFLNKVEIPKDKQRIVLDIVRGRNLARVRFGDILLSDIENNPGRIVVEVCFQEDSQCIQGQSWSTLFASPSQAAWNDRGEGYSNKIANGDERSKQKFINKFFS